MTLATIEQSAALQDLVRSIRHAVGAGGSDADTARRVAELLEPFLRTEGLLNPAQREPDPTHYRQHILHVEEDGGFSIVALVWLPGQETPIHDHVSWCVVGVQEGQEHETRYRIAGAGDDTWLVEDGSSVNPPGSIAALTPPGDIHKVANQGAGLAISLHIYGADIGKLGSSIRRRYDLEVRPS